MNNLLEYLDYNKLTYVKWVYQKIKLDLEKSLVSYKGASIRIAYQNLDAGQTTFMVWDDVLHDSETYDKIQKLFKIKLDFWQKKLIEKDNLYLSYEMRGLKVYTYIKKLKVKRVSAPKKIYHQTILKNLNYIKREGLLPKSFNWSHELEYPPAIFFTTAPSELFYDNDDSRIKTDELRIIEIDTTGLKNKWYVDLNTTNYMEPGMGDKPYIMTFEPVPASAIKIIRKKSIKD